MRSPPARSAFACSAWTRVGIASDQSTSLSSASRLPTQRKSEVRSTPSDAARLPMSMRREAMNVSRADSNARTASGWDPSARRSESQEGAASDPTVAIVTAVAVVLVIAGTLLACRGDATFSIRVASGTLASGVRTAR